ncbi:MAG: bis(5'-nucleosyl)-tetraphosphatase (symmetrical) YqeK [Clostridia bacterium]|nr:bis(5'-nucleosyl)-tetraphosphatase (symmetrical) YqeK [Clostridia bacterium]
MEPTFLNDGILLREKYNDYVTLLRGRLSEKRFYHSLAVAKEALRLAQKYGANTEKAFLAGLLHDICKDTPKNEQLQIFSEFGIILSALEESAFKLWHAMSGACYIQNILNIKDADIISAVRYHTTAKAGMSLLEKIIYLADFTSEDRDYEGADEMRKAVDVGLEHAMREALIFTIDDLKQKGMPVHEDTLNAYREIV